ncbi:MAG: class I SAM-dependent methyltransferase [Candidatus Anstonellaceae archaeon]
MRNEKLFQEIKNFYNTYPYPNQKIVLKSDLFHPKHDFIMRKILNAANLKKANLSGLSVLDAGCGTGEKSLYLAFFKANVDAFDFSASSIKIARKNAQKLKAKVNYFVSSFESFRTKKKYHLILCIGSLHHSLDAKGNFLKLSSFLKRDGIIVLGLYNSPGRFFLSLQRFLLKFFFKTPQKIVNFLVHFFRPKTKTALVLLADKYATPFESYHSIEEILEWFKEADLKPIKVYPQIDFNNKILLKLVQIYWLFSSKSFFFISGKKTKD